jgi:hypothetical protein
MIPDGVRGNKRRKEDQFKLMKEIRTLLPLKNDYEIMKILRMPNSTFYRYKVTIYEEDKEVWSAAMFEPLESRALAIYHVLQDSIRTCKQIADNKKTKPMDRLKACKRMVNDQYNILYLLKEGPNWHGYHTYF